jgi:3-deoxy-D-manno-octulosonic-acid transferase
MARALYTLAWWLALPFVPLRLLWRARREPGYAHAIGERFGTYRTDAPRGRIVWIHAVSVGETRAAAPLIERLRSERPDTTIVLTCMTAAGRETGRALYGNRVVQAWLPYDLPFAVRRFLAHFRPALGILMETELWPNLIAIARQTGVPMFVANARLSQRSARGYARFPALTRPMLESLDGIGAQAADDGARLSAQGARNVVVTGNLKFDVAVPPSQRESGVELRARIGSKRAVWLAASTRDGEEGLILDALARRPPGDALLLLVPRHPQRFDAVAELLASRGIAFARRSEDAPVTANTQVLLGDTMGEMFAYCAASDVAFVGGSLLPLGGQNLLEPLALGVPVLVGPHTFNFADVAQQAITSGAARRLDTADALLDAVARLIADEAARERMRDAGLAFVARHRGAVDRLWSMLATRV